MTILFKEIDRLKEKCQILRDYGMVNRKYVRC